jgi:hypothetical protein
VTGTDSVHQYRVSHPSKRSSFNLDWNLNTTIAASHNFPVSITVKPGLSPVEPWDDQKKTVSKRRRYKIAYLILVHDNKESLLEMFKYLHSQDAIFLIHVDRNYPELQTDLQNHINEYYKDSNNIHFFEKPFYLQW